MKEPENYADVKKAYHAFLAGSNMLDLIDIYQKCYGLGLLAEDESISPVSIMFVWPHVVLTYFCFQLWIYDTSSYAQDLWISHKFGEALEFKLLNFVKVF